MSATEIALLTILAAMAAGGLGWVVNWVIKLSREQSRVRTAQTASAQPQVAQCVLISETLKELETKVAEILVMMKAWEQYRWTANETALKETSDAVRELIKALGRLDV